MTTAERWHRVALVRAAINELATYVPELKMTAREIEQVKVLRNMMQDWVTDRVREYPASFNLVCHLLGADAFRIRQALRI